MDLKLFIPSAILSFAAGAIPFGVIVSKYIGHIDLSKIGSGNIGATNVYRAMGLKWGAAVFLGDSLKGLVPVLAGRELGLPPGAIAALAVLAVCAHIFNPLLRFKGGKGVATAFGAMLGIAPGAALIAFLAWAAIAFSARLISLASLVAALTMMPATYIIAEHSAYKIVTIVLAALVVFSHRENIGRLLKGEEAPAWTPRDKTPPK